MEQDLRAFEVQAKWNLPDANTSQPKKTQHIQSMVSAWHSYQFFFFVEIMTKDS